MGSFTFSDSPLTSQIQSGSGGISASDTSVEVASIPSDVSQGDIVKVGLGDASAWGAENGELVYGTVGAVGGGANGGTVIQYLRRGLEETTAASWSEGTTVRVGLQTTAQNDALSHNVRGKSFILEKTLFDLEQGNRDHLTVYSIGDSYSLRAFTRKEALPSQLHPYLSDTYHGRYSPVPGSQCGSYEGVGTFTTQIKTDYTVDMTGTYLQLSSSGEVRYGPGPGAAVCDRLGIVLIQESGAGSARIRVARGAQDIPGPSSGDWRAPTSSEITSGQSLDANGDLIINLDGSKDAVRVELDFGSVDRTSLQILHESGSDIRVENSCQFLAERESALNISHTKTGSWSAISYDTTADPFEAARIDILEPDVIVLETDDGIDAYRHFLPKLRDLLDKTSLSYDPYVVVTGMPWYGFTNEDADEKYQRNEYAASFCRQYGWDYVAAEQLVGGEEGLKEAGLEGDEVHFDADFWKILAEVWADDRGIKAYRTRKPGGNTASNSDLLDGQEGSRVDEKRELTAEISPSIGAMPVLDGSDDEWSATTSGSGAYDESPSVWNALSTGSTSGSDAVVAISDNYSTPYGREGRVQRDTGIFAYGLVVKPAAFTAAGESYFLTAQSRGAGDSYQGALTDPGFGARITQVDSSTVVVEGVYYDGSTQQVQGAVQVPKGNVLSLQMVKRNNRGNSGNNEVSVYANNQAMIKDQVVPRFFARTPYRFGAANNGDASNVEVRFRKPKAYVSYI